MLNSEHVEQVYAFVWRDVNEREALPYQHQIAEALRISREEVSACTYALRQ